MLKLFLFYFSPESMFDLGPKESWMHCSELENLEKTLTVGPSTSTNVGVNNPKGQTALTHTPKTQHKKVQSISYQIQPLSKTQPSVSFQLMAASPFKRKQGTSPSQDKVPKLSPLTDRINTHYKKLMEAIQECLDQSNQKKMTKPAEEELEAYRRFITPEDLATGGKTYAEYRQQVLNFEKVLETYHLKDKHLHSQMAELRTKVTRLENENFMLKQHQQYWHHRSTILSKPPQQLQAQVFVQPQPPSTEAVARLNNTVTLSVVNETQREMSN